MKNTLKYMSCLLLFTLVSCESWLDIKPVDRISGRALFETRDGFVKALNGVYTELANPSIYGREMTAGVMDLLAQYYLVNGNYNRSVIQYEYENEDYGLKGNINNMWIKSYNLIVNLNIIIDECGDQNSVLAGNWHGIIKGEALALRAFLHLDMLRIFGPTYSQDPEGLYIPYVINYDQKVSPLLSSAKIKEFILKDLTDAIVLLKDSDPIVENGVMNSDSPDGNNALRYRQYRMNYYAAKALLARVYLWFGEKADAYTAATELLAEVGETVFPFVEEKSATSGTNPDRLFSPEVMFAVSDVNRTNAIYDKLFVPTLDDNNLLRMAYVGTTLWSGRISQLFVTQNDLRYKAWFSTYTNASSKLINYVTKYSEVKNAAYMAMIPLIRITEVYLIAAECAPSLAEGDGYLKTVRAARTAYDLESDNWETLMNNIEWEYRREFMGEGQMFYFYKRINKQSIPAGQYTESSEVLQMGKAQYVIPVPDSEINERPIN